MKPFIKTSTMLGRKLLRARYISKICIIEYYRSSMLRCFRRDIFCQWREVGWWRSVPTRLRVVARAGLSQKQHPKFPLINLLLRPPAGFPRVNLLMTKGIRRNTRLLKGLGERKTPWIHPPELETAGRNTGQTWPLVVSDNTGVDFTRRPSSRNPSKKKTMKT